MVHLQIVPYRTNQFYIHNRGHTLIFRLYSGITGLQSFEVLTSVLPSKVVKSRYYYELQVLLIYCVYEAQNAELSETTLMAVLIFENFTIFLFVFI